jgi:hypothetical protein
MMSSALNAPAVREDGQRCRNREFDVGISISVFGPELLLL